MGVYVVYFFKGYSHVECAPNQTYVAWVASVPVFNDNVRRLFAIDANGVLSNVTLATSGVYDFTTRPWFSAKFGWTGVFGAFASPDSIRSFSYPMPAAGGVAATSWYAAEAPQCNFSAALTACNDASYAPAAAEAAAAVGSSLMQISTIEGVAVACTLVLSAVLGTSDVRSISFFHISVYYGPGFVFVVFILNF